MVRGRLACDVTRPKAAFVGAVFGPFKVTRFVKLNASARNCRFTRSTMNVFFDHRRIHVVDDVAAVLAERLRKRALIPVESCAPPAKPPQCRSPL